MNASHLVSLFQNADRAHGALADGIRETYALHAPVKGAAVTRWDFMEYAVSELYAMDRPTLGLRAEKIAGEKKSPAAAALNLWSATVRSRINSALKPLKVKTSVSIKTDKLRPGRVQVEIEVSEIKESANIVTVRKALESMLAQISKLAALEGLEADEAAAIDAMNEAIFAASEALDSRID